MIQSECGLGWKLVLVTVLGLGSDSWVINDDVIWVFSGEVFALDTSVLCE